MTAAARPTIIGPARPTALEWLGFELAAGELLELKPREARLLRILAEADGKTLTLVQVGRLMGWRGTMLEPMTAGALKVHATHLRHALEDIGLAEAFPAGHRGAPGYALNPDAVEALWSMIGERL